MDAIQQIYYTHCTEQTSFLKTGMGYGVRGASFKGRKLEQLLSDVINPLLVRKYELPQDVPNVQHRCRSAGDSPVRMFYYPAWGDFQVLGRICYRTFDVTNRPGSYFAHFLVAAKDPSWTAATALRLWNTALWQSHDQPSLAPPAALASLDPYLETTRPAIDDQVLHSFLVTQAEGDFDDPGGVVPELCQEASAAVRQELLALLMRGFLELDDPSKSLLLVADPELAALLFYGMLRLIPPTVLGEHTSFSTFETDLRSLPATLTATTFDYPDQTDLTPQQRETAGFWLNAFQAMEHADFRHERPDYPRFIINTLTQHGWPEVQRLFHRYSILRPRTADDLEHLARMDALVGELCAAGGKQIERADFLRRPFSRAYARLAIADLLIREDGHLAAERLAAVADSTNVVLVLDLLLEGPDEPKTSRVAKELLRQLKISVAADIAPRRHVPFPDRARLLGEYVEQHQSLPPPLASDFCLALAESATSPAPQYARELLADLLMRSSYPTIYKLYEQTPPAAQDRFLSQILNACEARPVLEEVVKSVVAGWDRSVLGKKVLKFGPPLIRHDPGGRLKQLIDKSLDGLGREGGERKFRSRLQILTRVHDLLEPAKRDYLEKWREVEKRMSQLRNRVQQLQQSGQWTKAERGRQPLPCLDECRQLVESFQEIQHADEPLASRKKHLLNLLSHASPGETPFPHDVFEAVNQQLLFPTIQAAAGDISATSRALPNKVMDKWTPPQVKFDFSKRWSKSLALKIVLRIQRNGGEIHFEATSMSDNVEARFDLAKLVKQQDDLHLITHIGIDVCFTSRFWISPIEKRNVPLPIADPLKQRLKVDTRYVVELRDGQNRVQHEKDFLDGLLNGGIR